MTFLWRTENALARFPPHTRSIPLFFSLPLFCSSALAILFFSLFLKRFHFCFLSLSFSTALFPPVSVSGGRKPACPPPGGGSPPPGGGWRVSSSSLISFGFLCIVFSRPNVWDASYRNGAILPTRFFMQMYSLYDVKAEEYLAPFEAASPATARRSIIDLLARNREENRFVRHREDYVLVRLGDFNAEAGVFDSAAPTTVTTLSALYDDLLSFEARDSGGLRDA